MKQTIYGRNPVREWLAAGLPVDRLYVAPESAGDNVSAIEALAQSRSIVVERVRRDRLERMARGEVHQGVAADVDVPGYADLDAILAVAARKGDPPVVCLLDGVQDPHNFGAIIRTAEAAGVHGLVVPKDRSVGLTPAVFKASAGAAALVPVAQVVNLARTLEELKELDFWIIGAVQGADRSYTDCDFKGPVGLVLGGEGKGIRHLVREKCDFLVSIPMCGKVASLNVSVTAGILFYEMRRQREGRKKKDLRP